MRLYPRSACSLLLIIEDLNCKNYLLKKIPFEPFSAADNLVYSLLIGAMWRHSAPVVVVVKLALFFAVLKRIETIMSLKVKKKTFKEKRNKRRSNFPVSF